jgi:hypothetical protein
MNDEMFIRKLHALFSYKKQMRDEMFEAFLDAYILQYAQEATNDEEYQQRLAHARNIARIEAKARFSSPPL